MAKTAPATIVVVPSLDSHLAQSMLCAEETVSLATLTGRIFENVTAVALARVSRAVTILGRRERAYVEREGRTIRAIHSSDQMSGAYMQLDSCMFLMIYTIENPLT